MAQQDDLLQDDMNDDTSTQASDTVTNDDADAVSAAPVVQDTTNPIVDLEKATEKEAEFSEPEGLEDPGFVDDANWEAIEVERGAGRGTDDEEEDLESLGMHVEEVPASSPKTADPDDLDNLDRFDE